MSFCLHAICSVTKLTTELRVTLNRPACDVARHRAAMNLLVTLCKLSVSRRCSCRGPVRGSRTSGGLGPADNGGNAIAATPAIMDVWQAGGQVCHINQLQAFRLLPAPFRLASLGACMRVQTIQAPREGLFDLCKVTTSGSQRRISNGGAAESASPARGCHSAGVQRGCTTQSGIKQLHRSALRGRRASSRTSHAWWCAQRLPLLALSRTEPTGRHAGRRKCGLSSSRPCHHACSCSPMLCAAAATLPRYVPPPLRPRLPRAWRVLGCCRALQRPSALARTCGTYRTQAGAAPTWKQCIRAASFYSLVMRPCITGTSAARRLARQSASWSPAASGRPFSDQAAAAYSQRARCSRLLGPHRGPGASRGSG